MQAWLSLCVNGWLVVAVVLFALILFRTLRPAARAAMERNARIPFEVEDERHG